MTDPTLSKMSLPVEREVLAAVQGQRALAAYLATQFETQRIQIFDDKNQAHQVELPTRPGADKQVARNLSSAFVRGRMEFESRQSSRGKFMAKHWLACKAFHQELYHCALCEGGLK